MVNRKKKAKKKPRRAQMQVAKKSSKFATKKKSGTLVTDPILRVIVEKKRGTTGTGPRLCGDNNDDD